MSVISKQRSVNDSKFRHRALISKDMLRAIKEKVKIYLNFLKLFSILCKNLLFFDIHYLAIEWEHIDFY